LDTTSGIATDWRANTDGPVSALAMSGGALYVGGAFTRIAGQQRFNIAAIDVASGSPTSWNPNPGGVDTPPVTALAVSGSTIYVGGYFNSMGGQPRNYVAA